MVLCTPNVDDNSKASFVRPRLRQEFLRDSRREKSVRFFSAILDFNLCFIHPRASRAHETRARPYTPYIAVFCFRMTTPQRRVQAPKCYGFLWTRTWNMARRRRTNTMGHGRRCCYHRRSVRTYRASVLYVFSAAMSDLRKVLSECNVPAENKNMVDHQFRVCSTKEIQYGSRACGQVTIYGVYKRMTLLRVTKTFDRVRCTFGDERSYFVLDSNTTRSISS